MSFDYELVSYEPQTPEKPMWMQQQESKQGNNRHRRWTREDNVAKKKRVAKRRADVMFDNQRLQDVVVGAIWAYKNNTIPPVATLKEYYQIIEAVGTTILLCEDCDKPDIVCIIGKIPMTTKGDYGEELCTGHYRLYIVPKDTLMLYKAIQIDEPIYLGKLNTR